MRGSRRRIWFLASLAIVAAVAWRLWLGYLPAALQKLAAAEADLSAPVIARLDREWSEDVATAGIGAAESDRWRELRETMAAAGASADEVAGVAGVIQTRYPAESTVAAPVHAQVATILWRRYWAVTVCWGDRPSAERGSARPAHMTVLVVVAVPPRRIVHEHEIPPRQISARLAAPTGSSGAAASSRSSRLPRRQV